MSKATVNKKQAALVLNQAIRNSQVTKLEVMRGKGPIVQRIANNIKRAMLNEFLSHPVTKEILAGGDAESNFLPYGNLFSFIGFTAGDEPIEPILDRIEAIQVIPNPNPNARWEELFLIINYPEPKDIFDITPMPWASGRSWAKGIERGISGLGQYLYHPEGFWQSRSGSGLQVKKGPSAERRFTNTPYISALLSKYRGRFQSLDNTAVL